MFWHIAFYTKVRFALGLIKYIDLLEFMIELDIHFYLTSENIMTFSTELDIYRIKR